MIVLWALVISTANAQRELLPVTHPVYQFLLRQELRGITDGFQWGTVPLTRGDVARFLRKLTANSDDLSAIDRGKLDDFNAEFEYDIHKTLHKSSAFFSDFTLSNVFDNERQKYLMAYEDSVASFFIDGFGFYSYRIASGDSVGSPFISLGELGLRLRGTLYDRLGFYLEASNGERFSGDPQFGRLDYQLKANTKFQEKGKYFDFTTGYLHYDADWLRLTFGREQILWGAGYGDRMILSNNTVPFDFAKIDLRYKSLHYSFLHGSLVGKDSSGAQLSSKYLSTHRLEFDVFPKLRLGLSEMILYSNRPVNFAFLNPFIFLSSANRSADPANPSNALIGIDFAMLPLRNVRVVGTLLIDDLDFETLGIKDARGNDNKFGWQFGVLWTDALGFPNLTLNTEYTRIDPFVYSHRTVANGYSHLDLPLGPLLQPNSDEWLLGLDFNLTYRLSVSGQVRFQRTGENLVDSKGRMIFNAGSDILRGDGDFLHPNVFLEGRRINRTLVALEIKWEPIKQYFLELKYFHRTFEYLTGGRKLSDSILWTTVRLDY